jgi:hypothetical protein
MILFRRRLELYQRLLDNNRCCRVIKTLLFGQRERVRPVWEVEKVQSLGSHHKERVVVGRRET